MPEKKHNRRYFLKTAASALLIGGVVLWQKMVRSEKALASTRSITIPFDTNREVTFHKHFIIVNRNGVLQVFSSHCTHLGCTIHRMENGKLICPCHGSTFSLDGKPTKGPAIKPLENLSYSINETNQMITIEL